MAEKRMFAKTIVLSDAFLDMPLSARCLYFTLGMLGDDDGFINNPKSIMRQCGASDDDMKVLLAKKFVLAFESGVIVIKHWRINNLLRSDRYQPTKYVEEKEQLQVEENGSYSFNNSGIPSIGIPSIDKDSIVKNSIDIGENKKILLQDNTEYEVEIEFIKALSQTYKNVDMNYELDKMAMWCKSNPSKRKTRAGIKRFINSWLERANTQNKTAGVNPNKQTVQKQNGIIGCHQSEEDRKIIEEIWGGMNEQQSDF